jgi:hypothetical protein
MTSPTDLLGARSLVSPVSRKAQQKQEQVHEIEIQGQGADDRVRRHVA